MNTIKIDNYFVSFEPLSTGLDKESEEIVAQAYPLIAQEPARAVEMLEALYAKIGDNPIVINNLSIAYNYNNQTEKAEELQTTLLSKYPDYLYSKLIAAQKALAQRAYEQIPVIFNNAQTLKELYPERDTFHAGEVLNFSTVMCRYNCRIQNMALGAGYLNIVKYLAPKDDAVVKALETELAMASLIFRAQRNMPAQTMSAKKARNKKR